VFKGKWMGLVVAVKVVPDHGSDSRMVMRCAHEIAILTALPHPNIVQVCMPLAMAIAADVARCDVVPCGLHDLLHGWLCVSTSCSCVSRKQLGSSCVLTSGVRTGCAGLHVPARHPSGGSGGPLRKGGGKATAEEDCRLCGR
jgi:hypothetical protein